uniref:Uncharacterized protein n=1 Tax=Knipowitschia caucasica TaxID=637954 RepID=A0AAV2J9X1_KNICA
MLGNPESGICLSGGAEVDFDLSEGGTRESLCRWASTCSSTSAELHPPGKVSHRWISHSSRGNFQTCPGPGASSPVTSCQSPRCKDLHTIYNHLYRMDVLTHLREHQLSPDSIASCWYILLTGSVFVQEHMYLARCWFVLLSSLCLTAVSGSGIVAPPGDSTRAGRVADHALFSAAAFNYRSVWSWSGANSAEVENGQRSGRRTCSRERSPRGEPNSYTTPRMLAPGHFIKRLLLVFPRSLRSEPRITALLWN